MLVDQEKQANQKEMDLQKGLVPDKIVKVVLFSLSIPPTVNSWLKTCISEGNPGAKLKNMLHSKGGEKSTEY